ncbi:MAG: bacteriophage holin, partial [Pseudomonadota bacterium]
MKLHALALGLTLGILWGGAILLTGLANLIWPGYGMAFLEVVASIYPGFAPGGGVGTVLLGSVYGLADGVIG